MVSNHLLFALCVAAAVVIALCLPVIGWLLALIIIVEAMESLKIGRQGRRWWR
jgi:hypothetical protein